MGVVTVGEAYAKHICPICGKKFFPEYDMFWVYRIGGYKYQLVCSYTCMRKWQLNPKSMSKPKKERRKIRIVETGEVFNSTMECAEFFNTTRQAIYNSFHKSNGKYKGFHLERVIE